MNWLGETKTTPQVQLCTSYFNYRSEESTGIA